MQYSSNYRLKLMEGTDLVKRQDFVDNFTTIDTTLGNKAEKNHNHDDRYYTESEINSKLNDKVNGKSTVYTSENIGELGLTFPCTCQQLVEAMRDGDVTKLDTNSGSIISDFPSDDNGAGSLFCERINKYRGNFVYRSGGNNNTMYIANYRHSSSPQFSGWKKVLTEDDSGWINAPLNQGINGTLKYRLYGKLVEVRGYVSNILGPNTYITTLPTGFRLTGQEKVFVSALSGTTVCKCGVQNAGGIRIIANNTGVYNSNDIYEINVTYLLD